MNSLSSIISIVSEKITEKMFSTYYVLKYMFCSSSHFELQINTKKPVRGLKNTEEYSIQSDVSDFTISFPIKKKPRPPSSPSYTTDCHNITEILLKAVFYTHNLNPNQLYTELDHLHIPDFILKLYVFL